MRNVEIKAIIIGSTQPDNAGIREWLDHVGATNYVWPRPDDNLTGAEAITGLAAKRCYLSFEPGLNPNVTKVRSDWNDYFENILKSGHGSVLEHASYNVAIEGVSRVFTGEMNRHRAGVGISEGSMRYIRFTDIPWWMPTSIRLTPAEEDLKARFSAVPGSIDRSSCSSDEEYDALLVMQKKVQTQRVFGEVFTYAQDAYTKLVDMWNLDGMKTFHLKKQLTSCLRRIIPMGVATGGVWTMNLRAVRHILALRTSEAAEEEIALVFSQIAKQMVEREPRILCDFAEDSKTGCWVPKYPKV